MLWQAASFVLYCATTPTLPAGGPLRHCAAIAHSIVYELSSMLIQAVLHVSGTLLRDSADMKHCSHAAPRWGGRRGLHNEQHKRQLKCDWP